LGEQNFKKLIKEIKAKGKNKEYDCVVGVSGGRDSTYTLYTAVKQGLRPLAVHFDNGWNSEIAVNNIKKSHHQIKRGFAHGSIGLGRVQGFAIILLKIVSFRCRDSNGLCYYICSLPNGSRNKYRLHS
jgi:3'-phosphoadenosine 5'-phosphosulfate sulfotransferase (PAPS reductase)/FAD synthetase